MRTKRRGGEVKSDSYNQTKEKGSKRVEEALSML
jgi:hypothetical protein